MPTSQPTYPAEPVIKAAARPLPLSDVRLTGGPLKHAQDLDAEYLLKLEPDRMLAHLRTRAGLTPKAKGYGGWDGEGRQLTGHIAGHYLSAVSYMYGATGDARFKERGDYIIGELKEIQDKHGNGYIGALMGNGAPPPRTTQPATKPGDPPLVEGELLFDQIAKGSIRSGGFDLNGMWSPWYVQHKIYAGLRDAYRLLGNRTTLEVETKFAAWAESIVGGLSDEQTQKMLATEFGGMNEVFVDLYADTGDRRWLTLADKFQHKAVVEPLSRREDNLAGKHGNTQVPKLLGNLVRYVYTGDEADGTAARFFWDAVVDHHSFATAGHGYDEYFGPADKLSGQVDGTGQRSHSLRTAETCNVYNMLKMTRLLFALKPDVRYADFQERALYNHILSSIDPKDGRTCYMVPVGPGAQREYQSMFDNFTCCVGTGMESHALHADGMYVVAGDRLFVNFYAPTTAQWKSAGVSIAMDTTFPEGDSATIKVTSGESKAFTLSLRRPKWAGDGFAITVNGQAVVELGTPDSFVDLTRTWNSGDVITVSLPKSLHTEPLPDNPNRAALMWGPLVLAGDLGPERRDDNSNVAKNERAVFPVFVAEAGKPIADWLKPVSGKSNTFRATTAVGREITFSPFYALHDRRYGVYWDLFTHAEWAAKQAEYAAEQEKQRKLAAATVAYAQPGEMQPERDFNFQGEESTAVRVNGSPGRKGTKWFSFDLPVDPSHPLALAVTLSSDEGRKRTFEILVDGKKVADHTIENSSPSRMYDVQFPIPADSVKGKNKVTVRFQAAAGSEIPGIFGIRILRTDAER